MTADEFLKLARDHYWDTLEPQRELIIKHLEGIVAMTESPKEQDVEVKELWEDCSASIICPFCGDGHTVDSQMEATKCRCGAEFSMTGKINVIPPAVK